MSVLVKSLSYRESNKWSKKKAGIHSSIGVQFTEVSVEKESTVLTSNNLGIEIENTYYCILAILRDKINIATQFSMQCRSNRKKKGLHPPTAPKI